MKIIYHHRTQGEEPESIHILSMVNALRDLGHEVEIVGPTRKDMSKAGSAGGILSRIKNWSPAWLFELLQIGYNLIVYLRLRKVVNVFQPDFIYERYALYNFSGVMVSKFHDVPLILEVNTPYAYAWDKYYKVYLKKLAKTVERKVLVAANHIFTVTHVQKEFLGTKGIDLENISVAHNAIDPNEFGTHIESSKIIEKNENAVVVGFVGTMNRWQGIPTFKKVVPDVLHRNENVIFLFVGDGEYRQQLESRISQLGLSDRVVFTGRRKHKEVPSLMRLMDIGVLPDSNDYGSPMKIFEYMAIGAAIVAPKVGPVTEVVVDGQTGLIINRGDASEMTEAILLLAKNKNQRHQLAEAGHNYVMQNHTWEKNASAVISIYRDRCC